MKVTNALGNAIIFSAVLGIASGCSDRSSSRSPTEANAVGTSGGMSSSRSDENEGSGSNFKIFGDADLTRDPENPTNIVLRVTSDASFTPAGAYRKLHNVQLWQLDHQLNFKYAFVLPHTCGGGSPRMILLIDTNGDGKFEQVPNGPDISTSGHVKPPYNACENGVATPSGGEASLSTLPWRFEDLTDESARWEITPGGAVPGIPAYPYLPWDAFEAAISLAFPNHRVLEAIFLEDYNVPFPGTAYYDLITVFDLTLGTRGQVQPERGNRNH